MDVAPGVLPSLKCRRCDVDFHDAAGFRSHWKDVHEPEGESDDGSDDDEPSHASWQGDAGADEGSLLALSALEALHSRLCAGPRHARALAHISDSGECVSVVRALLRGAGGAGGGAEETGGVPSALRAEATFSSIDCLVVPGEEWFLALYKGGFFAGIVVEVSARGLAPRTILHARFARYTTRRKQGGSQSAHDAAAGRAANSVGAQMRRAGEAALIDDVVGLLREPQWAAAIRRARRIWLGASATTTGQLYDGKTLVKGDARVQAVPLASGRPTVAEAERVAAALALVQTVGRSAALEAEADAAVSAARRLHAACEAERGAAAAAAEVAREAAAEAARAAAAAAASLPSRKKGGGAGRRRAKNAHRRHNKPAIDDEEEDSASDDGDASSSHRRAAAAGGNDADDDVLSEALAIARLEASRSGRSSRVETLSDAFAALHASAKALASVTGVPSSAILGAAGAPPSRVLADTVAGREALAAASAALELAASIVDEGRGLPAADAFAAMGWDGLAAAAGLAASGEAVDWNHIGVHGGGGEGGGEAQVALTTGGRKGGGGGKQAPQPRRAVDAVGVGAPLARPPQAAPLAPVPTPKSPEELRAERRALFAKAADARLAAVEK
jgi:hypothetical protein